MVQGAFLADERAEEIAPVGAFTVAVYAAQFFFGGWFVAHGLNQWLDFFPRPQGSSPIARELIGALNHSGLFNVVKGMEVFSGALMLANRFVPLAIVFAFPIALSIAHLNLLVNPDIASKIIGIIIMLVLGFIALGYLHQFAPMLSFNSGNPGARGLQELARPRGHQRKGTLRPLTNLLAAACGIAAAVGVTFWSTSSAGPRSAANAAKVTQEVMQEKQSGNSHP